MCCPSTSRLSVLRLGILFISFLSTSCTVIIIFVSAFFRLPADRVRWVLMDSFHFFPILFLQVVVVFRIQEIYNVVKLTVLMTFIVKTLAPALLFIKLRLTAMEFISIRKQTILMLQKRSRRGCQKCYVFRNNVHFVRFIYKLFPQNGKGPRYKTVKKNPKFRLPQLTSWQLVNVSIYWMVWNVISIDWLSENFSWLLQK